MIRHRLRPLLLAGALGALTPVPAVLAHGGKSHDAGRHAAPAGEVPAQAPDEPFPLDLGGPFDLIDQNGARRSDRDFHGRYVLLFFGYVNCKYMCSLSLRNLARAVDRLGPRSARVQPLLITVDPDADTPAVLRRELAKIHPRFLGLTGSPRALAAAYSAYHIQPKRVGPGDEGETIVSHTSYIYLLGPRGRVLTLLPPILSAKRMSAIIAAYLRAS